MYFDEQAETTIQTDVSQKGLGTVLLQNGQPICYASKALTGAECNYSNIERETRAVVWGSERFHYFIYRKPCTINTDHKPLKAIFEKKLSNCPPRVQRLLIRALKYDVNRVNVAIADALSRITAQKNRQRASNQELTFTTSPKNFQPHQLSLNKSGNKQKESQHCLSSRKSSSKGSQRREASVPQPIRHSGTSGRK